MASPPGWRTTRTAGKLSAPAEHELPVRNIAQPELSLEVEFLVDLDSAENAAAELKVIPAIEVEPVESNTAAGVRRAYFELDLKV